MEFLASPAFTLTLILLVFLKWTITLITAFEWRLIGGWVARGMFIFTFIYYNVFNPDAETARMIARAGFQLMFIDELINWTTTKFVAWRSRKSWAKGK